MVNTENENYKDAVEDTAYVTFAFTTNNGYIYFKKSVVLLKPLTKI